ncbi:MAG: thiamine pyrophosphate-binding protein [Alphaproteobacteria bacterium]|nr:thiamine pyrophosphate-binding protein [Alphaproteobacteria bacterium]
MAEIALDRRGLLEEIFPNHAEYLIVTGLAGAAKDTAALTRESDNLITLGGAMGAAVSMGLGVALGAPGRKVAVITGDGELMMNVGALATVASMMPDNLTIICIDNGAHGETGGQPGHTARRTNLALMAEGAGLPSTFTLTSAGQFEDARRFLATAPAPRFLWARVLPGPPAAYRRNWDLAECRLKFRHTYLAKHPK